MLGRPMPFSSISLMSVASVNRGGGSVKCWLASSLAQDKASPTASAGREFFSSVSSLSSRPSIYTLRNPANFRTEPEARKL